MLAGIFQIYSSMLNGVLTITRREGPLGLYRGIIPAMSQIAPQIGLQFGFYALLKEIWQGITNEHGSNISGNLENINNFFYALLNTSTLIYFQMKKSVFLFVLKKLRHTNFYFIVWVKKAWQISGFLVYV